MDPAQADVEVVTDELLDGLGVAVGHLAPAVEPERQDGGQAEKTGQQCRSGIGNGLESGLGPRLWLAVQQLR
jgi:hypothetical protein